MPKQSDAPPNMDDLNLSDSEEIDLTTNTPPAEENSIPAPRTGHALHSRFSSEEAREASLKRELESVRNVNTVIEGVIASLEKAKGNMSTVSNTVNQTSTLLQTWSRILSQTEHNQRLILSPNWQGATQDLADIEEEQIERQRAAERREIEERMRKEAAARKAEEDARRREAAAAAPSKPGLRGRGSVRGRAAVGGTRGRVTPTPGASSGYVGVGGQGGRGASRGSRAGSGTSGIGRGVRGGRRGLG